MAKFNEEKPVSIRMSAEMEKEIRSIAAHEKRSKNATILLLLERAIEEYNSGEGGLIEGPRPAPEAGARKLDVKRGDADNALRRKRG